MRLTFLAESPLLECLFGRLTFSSRGWKLLKAKVKRLPFCWLFVVDCATDYLRFKYELSFCVMLAEVDVPGSIITGLTLRMCEILICCCCPFLLDELRRRTGFGGFELSPPLLQLIRAVLCPN